VRRQHEPCRAFRSSGGAPETDDVAEEVGRDLVAALAEMPMDDPLDLVLEARDAVCVAELPEQFDVDGSALRWNTWPRRKYCAV
jgi:hypothetical protein